MTLSKNTSSSHFYPLAFAISSEARNLSFALMAGPWRNLMQSIISSEPRDPDNLTRPFALPRMTFFISSGTASQALDSGFFPFVAHADPKQEMFLFLLTG